MDIVAVQACRVTAQRPSSRCELFHTLWSSLMRRRIVFTASAVINASVSAGLASECTSNKDIESSRTRWAMVRSEPVGAAEIEKACRAYAASFYESVSLRQTIARCAGGKRHLDVLDSEINVLNDLLATKCSG